MENLPDMKISRENNTKTNKKPKRFSIRLSLRSYRPSNSRTRGDDGKSLAAPNLRAA